MMDRFTGGSPPPTTTAGSSSSGPPAASPLQNPTLGSLPPGSTGHQALTLDTTMPRVRLGAGALTDRRGQVPVLLGCPVSQSYCEGKVELDVAARGAHRVLVLGRTNYHIPGGKHARVLVRLATGDAGQTRPDALRVRRRELPTNPLVLRATAAIVTTVCTYRRCTRAHADARGSIDEVAAALRSRIQRLPRRPLRQAAASWRVSRVQGVDSRRTSSRCRARRPRW